MNSYRPFIIVAFFFIILFCIPKSMAQKIRLIATLPFSTKSHGQPSLEVENAQLKQEVGRLIAQLSFDEEANGEIERAKNLYQLSSDPFFKRRSHYLTMLIDRNIRGLSARVILREPVSWSRHVWLNVGEEDNALCGSQVVALGSPVVYKKAVVGVVEEVASRRCRVRLITDPNLNVSVRCVRGGEQDQVLARTCRDLGSILSLREEIEGAETLSNALNAFAEELATHEEAYYLAKGILHGGGEPLLRSMGHTLKGEGFNYDFADEEGPARDLRTGKIKGKHPIPLISTGDLLVTTGLDGIFPPDLPVAIVTKIHPLNEGECSYDLQAKAIVSTLNQLRDVTILPPL